MLWYVLFYAVIMPDTNHYKDEQKMSRTEPVIQFQ